MKSLELARKYLDCIYNTGNLKELKNILSENLVFKGVFNEYENAEKFLKYNEDNNLSGSEIYIKQEFEHGDKAAVFYEVTMPSGSYRVAQYFLTKDDKIRETYQIFDGRIFDTDEEDLDEWDIDEGM